MKTIHFNVTGNYDFRIEAWEKEFIQVFMDEKRSAINEMLSAVNMPFGWRSRMRGNFQSFLIEFEGDRMEFTSFFIIFD
jgi:hypothetical protein